MSVNRPRISSGKPDSPLYIYVSTVISGATSERNQYVPCSPNELHAIFERHFGDFYRNYDEKSAATYGRYRLERIQQLGERFSTCGDYLCPKMHGRATNEVSDQPSCSRKRTILFAEHLTNDVLLKLPHRQLVFTMPKALRPKFTITVYRLPSIETISFGSDA
jgi:hypothetical protein